MCTRKLQTCADPLLYACDQLWVEVAARENSPQRDRESSGFLPPLAQVDDLMEAVIGKGEAGFVDNHPCRCFSPLKCRHDLIERKSAQIGETAFAQLEQKGCGGQFTRNQHSFVA